MVIIKKQVLAIIIDEISMGSNDILFHIHFWLREIFGCLNNIHLQAFQSLQWEIFYNYLQFEQNQFMQSTMIVGKI